MEQWNDLYKELAEKISNNLTEVTWVDLWHQQVQYLTEELPFPTPAVFIAFKTLGMDDRSLLVQDCDTQVDIYLFYETFSDTYVGAYNQSSALGFLDTLTRIHQLLHGQSGLNYNAMRRVDLNMEESGGAGNLYRISFACLVTDESAMKQPFLKDITEVEVEKGVFALPVVTDQEPLFEV